MSEAQQELTIRITKRDGRVHVMAIGSRGERPPSHNFDPRFTDEQDALLRSFTAGIEHAAASGRPITTDDRRAAWGLWEALFGGAVNTVARRLEGATERPVLVRLVIRDPELQAVPWEALCEPETGAHFLGTSERMLVARGVTTDAPGELRRVRVDGAVRVVAIAPKEVAALGELEQSLAGRRTIAWLPPITGKAASSRHLFEKLREASPHIIHFIGHGSVARGEPELLLHDGPMLAEHLGQELAASLGGVLRLVVLEACHGARPSALGSAAEILARKGAHAVVAHLWSVRVPVARACSSALYRTLTGFERTRGDIVASLSAVRRTLLLTSAEAFSPVVYLRSMQSVIFDFGSSTLAPSSDGPPSQAGVSRSGPVASAVTESTPFGHSVPWTPPAPAERSWAMPAVGVGTKAVPWVLAGAAVMGMGGVGAASARIASSIRPAPEIAAPSTSPTPATPWLSTVPTPNQNDGTDATRPALAPGDDGFVDQRGGWDWGNRCWTHIQAHKWGWAKAECDRAMAMSPASPQPRASLLYNLGLIEKSCGHVAAAGRYFEQSLALREHPEVRAALESLRGG